MAQPTLRLAFAGSPEFAATILSTLQQSQFPCGLVLTQPDRPSGRGRKLVPNAVRKLADEQTLNVLQPISLKDTEAVAQLRAFAPDVLIVAAYGLLLPQAVLDIPTYGCLNVHASLLPRWRGAAPIERAVMAGDRETGVAIMQMEKGLDTGPVFASHTVTIGECTDIAELEQRLAENGATLLLRVLEQLVANPSLQPLPQPTLGVCYAQKLTAADRHIDWQQDAEHIARQVWALSHRMPAQTAIGGAEVQILAATALAPGEFSNSSKPGKLVEAGKKRLVVECGSGLLQLDRLRLNRGKGLVMDAAAARNGYADVLKADAVFATEAAPQPR